MLDNSLKKEIVKAAGTASATIAGGVIPGILAAALGVGVEALGLLGEKRTRELFDSDNFISNISRKIQESDDFASFVFNIWQKHNFESSKQRRKYLKKFLERETLKTENDYQNFSKVEYIL